MSKKLFILLLTFLTAAWKAEAENSIEECLDVCWDPLCTANLLPTSEDCVGCMVGNIGELNANPTLCCDRAEDYVSSINGNFSSVSSSTLGQCSSMTYNDLPAGASIANDYDNVDGGMQYFLYGVLQFNCTGCVKRVTIYTNIAIMQSQVSMIHIWSRKLDPTVNKTVLIQKKSVIFELSSDDSNEFGDIFNNTKEVSESLCFESGDVFGITMASGLQQVLVEKNSNSRQTYARERPSCADSLEKVYYLQDSEIVNLPVVAVSIDSSPTESLSSTSATISVSTSTEIDMQPSVSAVFNSSNEETGGSSTHSSSTFSPMPTVSRTSTSSSTTSTSVHVEPERSTEEFIQSPVFIAIVAIVAVLIIVILVVMVMVIGLCLYFNKNTEGSEMLQMKSLDSLDFQTQAAVRQRQTPSGSSRSGTPTHPAGYIHDDNGSRKNSQLLAFSRNTDYENPDVLDTTRITPHGSRDFLAEDGGYTTMHSRLTTPIHMTGSRSTVSDNSLRHQRHLHNHYDVPRNNNSDYDIPTALNTQFGTMDPYHPEELEDTQEEFGKRQYFVLDQDSVQSIKQAPHLPVYHVLEQGYHVPSAEERGFTQSFMNTEKMMERPFFVEQAHYWEPAEQAESIYDQLNEKKCRELKREDVSLVEEIGSGQFGSVWSGIWTLHGGGKKHVAVKECKRNAKEGERARLLREGARMMQFFNTHVVQLFGVVTIGEPLLLVLELMREGDLKDYLKNSRVGKKPELKPSQLLKFCRDVASGMKHLAKKKFVHRDLAARNILLDEKLICKIGDFGMTRSSDHVFDLSKREQVPLRWTAPEALKERVFSERSDVYSYGMLMYEIWSLGRNPFPLEDNNQTIIDFISQGRIMAPPPGCPREIYRLMALCWHPNYKDRLTFDGCSDFLDTDNESLLQRSSDDYEGLSPMAMELGAEIPYGYKLYKDLQTQYRNDLDNKNNC